MTINNSKSVINLKIVRRISIILYLAFMLLAFVAMIIKFPILGVSKTVWTIFLTACFLLIIFLPELLNYQYIYFSDEGDTIIFRYYTSGFIEGKKNSVEIGKKTFSGFTLDKNFFGLIQSITLYQRMKEGVAKYPPVFISALKREYKKSILESLNSYAPRVKGKKWV
jgi:E3 ubiquitin-protein ligase DOA10